MKVVLQGSITVQSGIVLLDPGAIRVEGGHVAALHEAWVMQRKYAGALSRPTRDSNNGPPPFRALQSGAKAAQAPEKTVQTGTKSLPSTRCQVLSFWSLTLVSIEVYTHLCHHSAKRRAHIR